MKKYVMALAALALLAGACGKSPEPEPTPGPTPEPEPEQKDTTPAELISFKLAAEDNADLDVDYAPEAIAENMVIRIPGGGQGKTLVARLTAGENDEIKVNDIAVSDGKASFDATFPVDILVTNTKSGKSAQYEVKIGKILEIVSKKLGTLPASSGMVYTSSSYKAAVNPSTGEMWVAYTFTPEGSVKNIGVKKFSNGEFVQVGTEGIVPAPTEGSAIATSTVCNLTFDKDGVPYILYYGGDVKNSLSCRKFDGSQWTLVGAAGFSGKINTSWGHLPNIYFDANGNPGFNYCTSGYGNGTFYFDGTDWQSTTITGFPEFVKGGSRGSNEGIFYNGPTATLNGKVYAFLTANWYGLYIYELSGSTWSTAIIQDYMEEGEKNMLPGNMATAIKDGKILLLATNQVAAQEQIYEFDGTNLAKYGDAFAINVSSSGSPNPAVFGVNPVNGQVMLVMLDDDGKPQYSMMDDNRKWESFLAIPDAPGSYGGLAMGFDKNGNALVVYPDAGRGEMGFPLYSIGLEDDILPE